MSTEHESLESKKAMAYDLLKLLKKNRDKSFDYDELEEIIDAYISGLESGS